MLIWRTPPARDGVQQLRRRVVEEKLRLCPQRAVVSFCGAEAILLTGSSGCEASEETLDGTTHLGKKKIERRCIRRPDPSPPSPQPNHPSSGTVSPRVFFIKDRQQIFFFCTYESHKGAEAETFTTHLPPINPGLVLRTNGYWAPSIGICASICVLSSSKRAWSSWAVITLKEPSGFSPLIL